MSNLVRQEGVVARISGDHFVLSASGENIERTVGTLAQQVRSIISSDVRYENVSVKISAAVGIALYPKDGDPNTLLSKAAAASNLAIQRNMDQAVHFDVAQIAAARAESAMVEALRSASKRGEFELHYQPKIHARTGQLTGVEALLRWNRPGHTMVSPDVFIPLAEQHGLIKEVGRWVLIEACRQMAAWRSSGLDLRVAINLSAQQLHQPTLAAEIASVLEHFQLDPALLTCEVTESVAMGDASSTMQVFDQLRTVGVQLSIDDFGTGYSSLSYLRRLPVHQLKIDRSFVTDLHESEDARLVAAAIVTLAHALKLEVVAEGVETLQQRDELIAIGCDKFQGYLFARPMTASALISWIKKRHDDFDRFKLKALG